MPTDSLNVFLQVWIQLNYVEVDLFLLFPRFRFEKKVIQVYINSCAKNSFQNQLQRPKEKYKTGANQGF